MDKTVFYSCNIKSSDFFSFLKIFTTAEAEPRQVDSKKIIELPLHKF